MITEKSIKYDIYSHISDVYNNMAAPVGSILCDIISVTHPNFTQRTIIYITHYNFYILCDIRDGLLL